MRFQLGSKITVDVRTGKETRDDGGELLELGFHIHTPWGPLDLAARTEAVTLRAILVWLRSNYGMMAYDFVAKRSHIKQLANLHKKKS